MHVYVCLRGHKKANIDTVRRNEMYVYFFIYKNLQLLLFVKELNSVVFFCTEAYGEIILFLKMKKLCVLVNSSRSPDIYIVFLIVIFYLWNGLSLLNAQLTAIDKLPCNASRVRH